MNKTVATVDNYKGMLEKKADDIGSVLPSHINREKFIKAAVTASVINPAILRCDRTSVLASLMKCAATGLVPDGQEAALVPYGNRATFLPMIFGVYKMLRQSAEVSSIRAEVVYEGEEFKVWDESGEQRFEHTMDPLSRGGKVVGAYAVAKLKDGTVELEVMPLDAIEKRRKTSSSQKGAASGPWKDWHEEMAKKTVVKYLAKRLPISSDDNRRLQKMDEADEPVDITPRESLEERLMREAAQNNPEPASEPVEGSQDVSEAVVVDGEVEPDLKEIMHEANPLSDAYAEGANAFKAGDEEDANPYDGGDQYVDWLGGYLMASRASD